VLLLHGFPETLFAFEDIALALADDFDVHASQTRSSAAFRRKPATTCHPNSGTTWRADGTPAT
jgi:hypothetical protein